MNRTEPTTPMEMAKYVITSLIEADVTAEDIAHFVDEIKPFSLVSFAVDLPYISLAVDLLKDVPTQVTAVCSYPLGGMTTEVKLEQVKYARQQGAYDIDVSMNYLAIKSGDFSTVEEEVRRLVDAAGDLKIVVVPQVTILTNDEKARTCEAVLKGGCKTIKTASGFGWKTEVEDVLFIKRLFGDAIHIEASGSVRTKQQALAMIEAGAESVHTSTVFQVLGIDKTPVNTKKE